jgi:hypothetical protein
MPNISKNASISMLLAERIMEIAQESGAVQTEILAAPLPDIKACGLCSHIHMGRCKEYAPNAQFSCACPGECPHGGHPAYCNKCNEPDIKVCDHIGAGK